MKFVTPHAQSFLHEGTLYRIHKDLEFTVSDRASVPVDSLSRVMSRDTYNTYFAPKEAPKAPKKAPKGEE